MNFVKRSKISLMRNLEKTIILGLLVTLLATLAAGSILIRYAVITTESRLKARIPPIVSISLNPETFSQHFEETGLTADQMDTSLSSETISTISNLPYVSSFQYTNVFFGLADLKLYEPTSDYFLENNILQASLRVSGISQSEPIPMQQGIIELVEGRVFTEREMFSDDCIQQAPTLISRSFAELNHLNLGSLITMYHIVNFHANEWSEEEEALFLTLAFDLEVVGIFDMEYEILDHQPNPITEHVLFEEYAQLRLALNAIYVPAWFNYNVTRQMNEILLNTRASNFATITERQNIPMIILNDISELDAFKEVATPLLPELLRFTDLSATHYTIFSSMETLLWIADIVLITGVGAAFLILSLLITLFFRDRCYEIGIYMALGEKQLSIFSQLLLEILIIVVLGMTIGLFIGNAISMQISHLMLRTELSQPMSWSEVEYQNSQMSGINVGLSLPPQTISAEDVLEIFNIALGAKVISLFYLVGLGTAVSSTLVPLIYVSKLNPRKILLK